MGERVSVIGAGGWGTALAVILSQWGHKVHLWAHSPETAERLNAERENLLYLSGVRLPEGLRATSDLEFCIRSSSRFLVFVVPSVHLRSVIRQARPYLMPHHILIHGSKGLEPHTGRRLSEMIAGEIGDGSLGRIAALSGPNHAEEVGRGLPTATVVASPSQEAADAAQELLLGPQFRVYTSLDIVGVELGGALKNIIALAAGISDGLGFGDNTKAAIITRGLAEISRLGIRLGANPLTFSGLSGLGDLVATCTSPHSRNARAGAEIGAGRPIDQVIGQSRMAIEGVPTTDAAMILARSLGVSMPITQAVNDVLNNGTHPAQAVAGLMERDPRSELDETIL